MKLSISNIAWPAEKDAEVYRIMKQFGFIGLEIAPTRIFKDKPYEDKERAKEWSDWLKKEYNFQISSMQSIWYGRQEKLFGSEEERKILMVYTKKAIDFAECTGCGNLVFGCPRNRYILDGIKTDAALDFFGELAVYAAAHNTVLSMEANPPLYHTNFINTTVDAFDIVKKVNHPGFKVNLDTGTMIENKESVHLLEGNVSFINHVHISEPGLVKIKKRDLHKELILLLKKENYNEFVSIEMNNQVSVMEINEICMYLKELAE